MQPTNHVSPSVPAREPARLRMYIRIPYENRVIYFLSSPSLPLARGRYHRILSGTHHNKNKYDKLFLPGHPQNSQGSEKRGPYPPILRAPPPIEIMHRLRRNFSCVHYAAHLRASIAPHFSVLQLRRTSARIDCAAFFRASTTPHISAHRLRRIFFRASITPQSMFRASIAPRFVPLPALMIISFLQAYIPIGAVHHPFDGTPGQPQPQQHEITPHPTRRAYESTLYKPRFFSSSRVLVT